jgi:hypothetical protein
VIVRLLLWSLADASLSLEELRARVEELDPLPAPGGWLWNEAQERFGALLVLDGGGDDEASAPPQIAALQALLGRDPDLFDEFDLLR